MPDQDKTRCQVVMDEQPTSTFLRINSKANVLVASGYSESGPANWAVTGGAKGFVEKPYNMRQLLTTVRNVLDEN